MVKIITIKKGKIPPFKTFRQWQKTAGKRGKGAYAFEAYSDDMSSGGKVVRLFGKIPMIAYSKKITKREKRIEKQRKYWK